MFDRSDAVPSAKNAYYSYIKEFKEMMFSLLPLYDERFFLIFLKSLSLRSIELTKGSPIMSL